MCIPVMSNGAFNVAQERESSAYKGQPVGNGVWCLRSGIVIALNQIATESSNDASGNGNYQNSRNGR